MTRTFRAGETVEDYCRACKTDRFHTVIVVEGAGRPIRVSCDHCDSQHNFRGGPRIETGSPAPLTKGRPEGRPLPTNSPPHEPLALVTDRERTGVHVSSSDSGHDDLELLLRRVIREETGLTPVAPAAKWRDVP